MGTGSGEKTRASSMSTRNENATPKEDVPTDALHAEGHIRFGDERSLVALIESRPTTPGVELGLGGVQGVAAALANEVPLRGVELIVLARPSGLSSLLAQHLE